MFKSAQELVREAKQCITEINLPEWADRLAAPEVLLIDVREPEEFRAGHIQGALNIPRGMLEFRISSDPALQNLGRPLLVYCKTSGRAALAAASLQGMGFSQVLSLAGGFDAWVADGRPLARTADVAFG